MEVEILRSKLHRATVTQTELNYAGSVTVDEDLMDAAGLFEYEKVQIVNINNGVRFETYAIKGSRGSGTICLNGAAARCAQTGDKVIIIAYARATPQEAKDFKPTIVLLDDKNKAV
ncbi:MAG: aspartate 1-decarboxylase [Holosporaceae bacterium]|jgi:aspartate 1-decarboxylase|nr:aspartate 1-decarboxylase [Holosporaceae bacterium]